jgi:TonB family protein
VPPAGGIRVGDNLILLTHDESLIEALVHVVPPDCLTVVSDESALAHHLLSRHAGVVFIDAGALSSRPGMAAELTQRLHHQLPDVVLVAAGDGVAQSELAAQVTDGTIYRFVHKPVSAQRVKLFVDAAWRKRDGLSSGVFPALSMPQLPPIAPMTRPVPWLGIVAAVVVTGAAIAWLMLPTNSAPGVAPAAPAAPRVTSQPVTPAAVPAAPESSPVDLDHIVTVTVRARANTQRPAAPATAPAVVAAVVPESRPVDLNHIVTVTVHAHPATAAPVQAAATNTLATRISSSPEMVGPPSSTPPVSEAKDRLSVAAIILQREYAPDPEFPERAREGDLAGFVDLEFTVNPDGSVANVTVLKSQPVGIFDRSAVAAVSQWRYRPIAHDGVPVSEHARLRLNFGYK